MSAAACMVLVHGRDITLGSLGDVRAYLAGDGYAALLTRDGTRVSQAIADPSFDLRALDNLSESELIEYVGRWEQRSEGQITSLPIVPNMVQVQLLPGEALVLVSDGAYRYAREPGGLFEDLLLKVLASASDAQVAAFRVMASANQRGGSDNISCIIYRLPNSPQ
jgi:PPM family protein phosphatase